MFNRSRPDQEGESSLNPFEKKNVVFEFQSPSFPFRDALVRAARLLGENFFLTESIDGIETALTILQSEVAVRGAFPNHPITNIRIQGLKADFSTEAARLEKDSGNPVLQGNMRSFYFALNPGEAARLLIAEKKRRKGDPAFDDSADLSDLHL